MNNVSVLLPVLSVLATLWISSVIGEECLHKVELWPAMNPTKFFYCNPNTNTRATGDCLPNTGFVKNDTVSGCVPWEYWNSECVTKVDTSTIKCGGTTYMRPKGATNPQEFFLCIGKDTAPVKLQCAEDRTFYSGHEYLGCVPWALWRNLTGCAA